MSSIMCRETDGNLDVKCAIFTHKELITIFLLYRYKTVNCFLSFLFLFFWPINYPKKYNTERVSNSKNTTFLNYSSYYHDILQHMYKHVISIIFTVHILYMYLLFKAMTSY